MAFLVPYCDEAVHFAAIHDHRVTNTSKACESIKSKIGFFSFDRYLSSTESDKISYILVDLPSSGL